MVPNFGPEEWVVVLAVLIGLGIALWRIQPPSEKRNEIFYLIVAVFTVAIVVGFIKNRLWVHLILGVVMGAIVQQLLLDPLRKEEPPSDRAK